MSDRGPHRGTPVPLHDISVLLGTGTPEWPGDTPFSCGWTTRIARGASVNLSAITSSPHVGTHADAPLHVADGLPASEALPLMAFVGPAVIWTVPPGARLLDPADLVTLLSGRIERLLVRTGCSIASGVFPAEWPALAPAAVHALLARGLRLLGVDAPSVDLRESTALDTHRALFEGGAFNIENLDLRAVADGPCELIALPLRISGLDAAPVRAVVR